MEKLPKKFRQPIYHQSGRFREWFTWGLFWEKPGLLTYISPAARTFIVEQKITDPADSMQFSGILDKENNEIYGDDFLMDEKGEIFRIYEVPGGFVIKAEYWKSDCRDLVPGDELIFESLSNPQISSWLTGTCQVIGNIIEHPKYIYLQDKTRVILY